MALFTATKLVELVFLLQLCIFFWVTLTFTRGGGFQADASLLTAIVGAGVYALAILLFSLHRVSAKQIRPVIGYMSPCTYVVMGLMFLVQGTYMGYMLGACSIALALVQGNLRASTEEIGELHAARRFSLAVKAGLAILTSTIYSLFVSIGICSALSAQSTFCSYSMVASLFLNTNASTTFLAKYLSRSTKRANRPPPVILPISGALGFVASFLGFRFVRSWLARLRNVRSWLARLRRYINLLRSSSSASFLDTPSLSLESIILYRCTGGAIAALIAGFPAVAYHHQYATELSVHAFIIGFSVSHISLVWRQAEQVIPRQVADPEHGETVRETVSAKTTSKPRPLMILSRLFI